MKTKSQNDNPAAAVERARAELEAAEGQLAGLDVHRGDIDSVLTRRRELQERAEIARARLTLAQDRAAVAAEAETEEEIAILMEQAQSIEKKIEVERARVDDELRKIFLADWLDGKGRFSSSRPTGRGLIECSSSVSELVERRGAIENEISRLHARLADGRARRDREAAAARVESRRRLLGGERVKIALTPWRLCPMEGHACETTHDLASRKIPCSIHPTNDRIIHALLPTGTRPDTFMDVSSLIHFEEMAADELCPAMSAVWQRSR